ncbi:MAG: hypothetical protein ACM3MG_13870, partial [Bacillota bacterium]
MYLSLKRPKTPTTNIQKPIDEITFDEAFEKKGLEIREALARIITRAFNEKKYEDSFMQNVVLGFVLFFVNFLFIGCSTGTTQKPDFIAQKVYDNQNLPKYDSHIESKNPDSNLSLSRLIFTCCNSDLTDQSGWRNIAQKKPDLVVLVGNTVSSVRLDQKPLYKQYQALDQNSAYTELRKDTPFMAVWDDLDYGLRFGD